MSEGPLNFERAVYGGAAVPLNHCAGCRRWIEDEFFRANGEMICTVCAVRIRGYLPEDTRATFWRATAVGAAVAAAAGLVYLVLFRLVGDSGMGIGIAFGAIGVGYAVGRGMRMAAKGAGGRRYQWVAAGLTFAAISVAVTGSIVGTREVPLWAYPFFAVAPVFLAVIGQWKLAGIELLFAWIGVQWAWNLLRPGPVKITGPEYLSAGKA
jgi:hypothetical protein